MKAIVIRRTGGVDVLEAETLPDPTPGPGEVVVAVEACGVCAHDLVVRNGTLKAGIELPLILGHEVSGRIVALGRDVPGFRVGDRVATTQRSHVCGHCAHCRGGREPLCDEAEFMGDRRLNGGYAEFVAVGADNLAPIPEGVDTASAAIAACAVGTALHALRDVARVRVGETVLVTGAGGGVGIHALQIARRAGCRVIAQTTTAAKAAVLRRYGADEVVVSTRGVDFSEAVRALTAGRGVDVVIDTVGTPVFASSRRSLAKGGRWTLVGQVDGGFVPFNPAQLFLRNISMLSATSTTRQGLRDVLDLVAAGAVEPVIADVLPLTRAREAHARLEAGGVTGRILLRAAA